MVFVLCLCHGHHIYVYSPFSVFVFLQYTTGDCTVSQADVDKLDWIKKAKVQAWKEQSGSSTRSAQARFLELLEIIAPGWAGAAK